MKTVTFAYLDASSLTEGFLGELYDLSLCKGETGFSFLVSLQSLLSWKQDMEREMQNGASYPYYEEIRKLYWDLKANGYEAVFVCNDPEFNQQ